MASTNAVREMAAAHFQGMKANQAAQKDVSVKISPHVSELLAKWDLGGRKATLEALLNLGAVALEEQMKAEASSESKQATDGKK